MSVTKERLFDWGFFSFYISETAIGNSYIADLISKPVADFLRYGTLGITVVCLFMIFLTKHDYDLKSIGLIFITVSLVFISYSISKSDSLIGTCLFMLAAFRTNFCKFNHYIIKGMAISVVIIALLSLVGLISATRRGGLGYSHVNRLAIILFGILCGWIYDQRKGKFSIKYTISLAIYLIGFSVTDSSTFQVVGGGVLFLTLFYDFISTRRWRYHRKYMKLFITLSVIFMIIAFAGIITYFYNNSSSLRGTLYSYGVRLRMVRAYYNSYGITLLGNDIEMGRDISLPGMYNSGKYVLDLGYMRLLIEHGLIISLLAIVLLVIYLYKLIKQKEWVLFIIALSYMLYLLAEHHPYEVAYNHFIVHIGIVLFSPIIRKKRKLYNYTLQSSSN